MILRRPRLTAIAAAVALVLGPVGTGAASGGTEPTTGPFGAAGIGDPYFPLDGNGGIDVLRYDVHDRYDFATGRLSGWTEVTLRVTQTLSGFNLDLLLPVSAVRVDGEVVPHRKSDGGNELRIEHPVRAGDELGVVVRYAGRPGRIGYDGEHNWLADAQEVVAMNQPHMAPWWFPANDHPLDKARMRISITVPRQKTVVAGGRLVEREVHGRLATTTWRSAEPMVPYLAFFAAGPFEVARGVSHGRPWYVAVSRRLDPVQRERSMRLMRRTPGLLRWLEGQLGAYPFAVTGGVTTSLDPGFALETQTRPTYPAMDGRAATSTVVHELAHQWLGNSVAVAQWRDIWLNEGAATFMEVHFAEHRGDWSGDQWLRYHYDAYDPRADFWNHAVADPCPTHSGCVSSIFAWWVYQRGAMALQALRNVIGERDFWTLLRRWVADNAGGNGSTEEFQALAEEVSGQDLDAFFQAWIHGSGKPADTPTNGLPAR